MGRDDEESWREQEKSKKNLRKQEKEGREWEWADKGASFLMATRPMPREPMPGWRQVDTSLRASAEHPGTGFYRCFPVKGATVCFSQKLCVLQGRTQCLRLLEGGTLALWLSNNWVPWLPSAAGETRRVFTQRSQCPQRTQLSVTWQTAGSGGAVSWALRLGTSSDVKVSSTVGMLPTLSPSSGGVGAGSFTNWDPTGGLKKKKKTRCF